MTAINEDNIEHLADVVQDIERIYFRCQHIETGLRPSVVLLGLVTGIIAKHEGDHSLEWMLDAMKRLRDFNLDPDEKSSGR